MTLQLPRIMYGTYRMVRPRLIRIAKRMRMGQLWLELVEEQGFLDVEQTSGLIVGDGPSPLLGSEEHFQMWLLWGLVSAKGLRAIPEIADDIFARSLTKPWSTLGLMSFHNQIWFHDRSRHSSFLRAVLGYWDDFYAIGVRYTTGSRTPKDLWSTLNCIAHVLAIQGVPNDALNAPPPPGGFSELIERYSVDISTDESRTVQRAVSQKVDGEHSPQTG